MSSTDSSASPSSAAAAAAATDVVPTVSAALPGVRALSECDEEMYHLIEEERRRQARGLELIASENFTSRAVMECLGSCLTNKYAEGLPGGRYYGGNEVIDRIERLCQDRALAAFGLNPREWGVNVQPYSGSPANMAVYTALLKPHDRIMGLDLPSGGHLTHGYYTHSKKDSARMVVSATSKYFESLPYSVHPETGLIDYDRLADLASVFRPNLIIAGGSAYPREYDFARFRAIADSCGALLMMDMAHTSGLVATGEAANPFSFCDVVTTTTHKSLRGPRAGMIFFRRDERGFETAINNAVFPALQGGPHMHQIAAIATQLKEVATPEFREYSRQVRANAKALAARLVELGHQLATGGTDNHLVLWDLRPHDITGNKMQRLCDSLDITLNKNSVFGDRSAIAPGGVRVGTPALTTRGFVEKDFVVVADLLHRALLIAKRIQAEKGRTLAEFSAAVDSDAEVLALRADVNALASAFPMPGLSAQ